MTLLILAAGLGSRYGGLKQLDGVGPNNELLIEYSIYDAIQAGFTRVVCIIKEEHQEIFEERISKKIRPFIEIEYAFQNLNNVPSDYLPLLESRTKPMGTGHAILCAKDVIGDDNFAVINADDFYGRDSYTSLIKHMNEQPSYCLSAYRLKNTVSPNGTVARGVCFLDENSFLQKVVEHEKIDHHFKNNNEPFTQFTGDTPVSMNFWGFTSDALKTFETEFTTFLETNKNDLSKCEYYLTYPINTIIEAGVTPIKVLDNESTWFGVTFQEDKPAVVSALREMIDNGVYPERLWEECK